jgi:hypothetical protein
MAGEETDGSEGVAGHDDAAEAEEALDGEDEEVLAFASLQDNMWLSCQLDCGHDLAIDSGCWNEGAKGWW